MAKATAKTARLTRLALLIALLAVLTFTPLGFIPLPMASLTIIHIPVIIAAILFGPIDGAILGTAFGLFSMWKATVSPMAPTDMLFSPFLSGKPVQSLLMVLLPRILLGLFAALLYKFFASHIKNGRVSAALAALLSTLCHSLMVLGLLSILFDGFPLAELFTIVLSVNGLLEMALATVLATFVCPPLQKALGQKG